METETQEKTRKALYRVSFNKDLKKWQITKDGASRVIANFDTKQQAVDRVKELSENMNLNFVVKKKDGKYQKKENI